MSFLKTYLFLLCLFTFTIVSAQSKKLDSLFNKKKYNEVIEELSLKEYYLALSTDESLLLSKAYSKVNKQYQSLLILNKLIPNVLKSNNLTNLSIAYNLKSENLVDLDKVDDGIIFCNEALPYIEDKGAPFLQELCIKCGILYNEGSLYQKAYKTYQKITKEDIKKSLIFTHNYGVILMNNKKYDNALNHLKKGIDIAYQANQTEEINVSLNNIAKILIAQKKWSAAKKYLDSVNSSFSAFSTVYQKKEWLKTYYYFYTLQGKRIQGVSVLNEIQAYHDRIYDFEIQRKTQELAAINQRKNILHKKVTAIDNEIKTTNKTKLTRYIFLVFIVIIVTSLILLYLYRNINLKYQKILNEQELLTSQMTPHFIFNSLSIVQGMVLNNEHKKASLYLSKFSNILKFIVRDQSQNFIPIRDEILGLKDYVDLQNLSTKKNMTFIVDIQHTIENDLLIPPMIIQPFIENAIIHGFKKDISHPSISMYFVLKEKILQCIITDNGVGFSSSHKKTSKAKSSLAIKIVEDRFAILSKKMNTKFSISIIDLKTDGKQGTQVILNLPYILKNNVTLYD